MTYVRFYLTHRRIISFGILLTLFSSFGQTFLISLFVLHLLAAFTLDTAQFGSAIVPGCAALALLLIGTSLLARWWFRRSTTNRI